MSNHPPRISVIMGVYNGEQYLKPAIDSILEQSFTDFDFIIVNDGSTDSSRQLIEAYPDPRIRLINQPNEGLVSALNRGILEARGTYIARMDADDISAPNRFKEQVAFLEGHPDVVLVGTAVIGIDETGQHRYTYPWLTEDEDIRQELYSANPFSHGSVMMRKDAFIAAGGYRSDYGPTEDYDLWRRLAKEGKLANLPEYLYLWRINPQGISQTNTLTQIKFSSAIQDELWAKLTPTRQSSRDVRSTARQYAKAGIIGYQIQLHYLRMQLRLAKLFFRHHNYLSGGATLAAFFSTGLAGIAVMAALIKNRVFRTEVPF